MPIIAVVILLGIGLIYGSPGSRLAITFILAFGVAFLAWGLSL